MGESGWSRTGDGRNPFESAVEQTAHAVSITDTDGVIEYVNPAFEELTGYNESETLGQPASLLQSGEHDDAFHADL
ncbi:MAG: PAS domain-containing protein [Haloglomus sp.]